MPAIKPAHEFPFPVVNGMVAVEHVRYMVQHLEALNAMRVNGFDPLAAARAYPRLVEMLQIVRTIAGMRLEQDDRPEWAKLKQCDALLAELGEDA